jgi:hypothetical protein
MRELETSLQQFAEFRLARRLVRPNAAPLVVRAVRMFLQRPAVDAPLADQVRTFCEDLERAGRQDWQVRHAEEALRIYFVNFLQRTDWHRQTPSPIVDPAGRVDPLAALHALRLRIRARHYSYRTETSYADWVRRFLEHRAVEDGPRPSITSAAVRNFLTHLAVHRRVSTSTQNQAQCALIFLAREVLDLDIDGLSETTRAKRGQRLPVVLNAGRERGWFWVARRSPLDRLTRP